MNLYLRLIKLFFQILFAKKSHILRTARLSFLVWPWDCDFNWHITNSRYLSFMDLGRIHFLGTLGIIPELIKRRWGPVVHSCEISFLRPLVPFQRFELATRVVTWDEKYVYLEQHFLRRGQLCAVGLIRGIFISKGEKIAPQAVMELGGYQLKAPDTNVVIERWQALIAAKRDFVQPFYEEK